MKKTILTMTQAEVQREKIKLIKQGFLMDEAYLLDQLIIKAQKLIKKG